MDISDFASVRMVTPPITVRLPADYHPLLRRIVALLKSDPLFTAALLDLVEGATDRNLSAIEGLGLDLRFRQLKAKVGRLERLSRPQGSGAFGGSRGQGPVHYERDLPSVETRAPKPALSAPRALAKRLLGVRLPGSDGGSRVMTRAEIERRIVKELGVSRGSAQSAASWAVRIGDPDNPERRTHRRPVARTVGLSIITKMQELKAQGLNKREIAERLGADVKTVRRHLGSRR